MPLSNADNSRSMSASSPSSSPQALCAIGWSPDQARRANVHQLASPILDRPLDADRGDYAAERPA